MRVFLAPSSTSTQIYYFNDLLEIDRHGVADCGESSSGHQPRAPIDRAPEEPRACHEALHRKSKLNTSTCSITGRWLSKPTGSLSPTHFPHVELEVLAKHGAILV
jgi:hypothetical protein